MTVRTLSHTITGNPDVVRIEVVNNYRDAVGRATLETRTLGGLGVGDSVEITMGYVGDTAKLFKGNAKSIRAANLPGLYTLECQDVLWQAQEFWFVPADLDNPWSRSNIAAEDLVQDILAEAQLTDYAADYSPGFTFATGETPVEIKLQSAWDVIGWICEITGAHVYADINGQVHYTNIDPVPGVSTHTLTTGAAGQIIFSDYTKSDDNARNKVVVFGAPGIKAEASAAPNGYTLPANFYKTAIISHGMIDTQQMAQDCADLNLTALNRLTESVRCDIEGDPGVECRDTVTVTEAFTGVSGDWFVLEARHAMQDAYKTQLTLTR